MPPSDYCHICQSVIFHVSVRRPALRIRQPIRILIRQDSNLEAQLKIMLCGSSENKGGTLRR